ncbi:ABC transporter ATP-binding protein [Undibacterium sp. CY18W]|uniref:ABC transporter ATP-binding protein n=2 Tax=Undibacterium hunanense TaxID=2762292 RepID=A0ABR6ZUR6_9BURK|nr:ABC transporter ATP-binding protein [Undibacterium hunanense]
MQDADTGPALCFSDVLFHWQARQPPCLHIADLRINRGESVFLYGPSGSGKSTLLSLAGGIITPQRGQITVLGTDLGALSGAARDRFRVDHAGFIFQQFNLIPYLSMLDNVLLPCRLSPRRRQRASEAHGNPHAAAAALLHTLGLDAGLHQRTVTGLSIGQQQRVAAARALIGQPEIIIADEPTSALDADRQKDFIALILQQCASHGSSLLFVSHDHRLASHFTRELDLQSIKEQH